MRRSVIATHVSLVALLIALGLLLHPAAASAGAWTTCMDRGYEDLKAHHVGCYTARVVWKRSFREAQRQGGSGVRFHFIGRTWTCRARNSSVYVWRCSASGRRMVQYRWLSGE